MAHSDTRKLVAVAVSTEAVHLETLVQFRIYQLSGL